MSKSMKHAGQRRRTSAANSHRDRPLITRHAAPPKELLQLWERSPDAVALYGCGQDGGC